MQYFLFKDIEYKGYLRSLKRIFIDIHMQIIKKVKDNSNIVFYNEQHLE
jgi:hypothetical protein